MLKSLRFFAVSLTLLAATTLHAQNVGIGTAVPGQKLEIAGTANTIRINGLKTGGTYNAAATDSSSIVYVNRTTGDIYALPTGGVGSILTISASGVPTWSTGTTSATAWQLTGNAGTTPGTNFIGTTDDNALEFITNNTISGIIQPDGSDGSVFLGVNAGNYFGSGATQSVAIGYQAAAAVQGGNGPNIAIGYQALANFGTNILGDDNVAIGYQSNFTSTGGQIDNSANTSVGDQSLFSSNGGAGQWNTAIGYQSMYSNGGGQKNTALGAYALFSINGGSYNTATGYNAMFNEQSGMNNTAVGDYSMATDVTGTNNTIIGVSADVAVDGLTNATAIGAGAIVSASNLVQLGSGASVQFDLALMPGGNAGTTGNILLSAGANTTPTWLGNGANGTILTISGGVPTWGSASTSATAWQLLGNTGIATPAAPATYGTSTITPGKNWLGTSDGSDIVFGTDNIERMRIGGGTVATASYVGIGTATPADQLHIVEIGNQATSADFGGSSGYNTALEIENKSGTMPILYINGSTANNPLAGIIERGSGTAFYTGLNNNANYRIAGITSIAGSAVTTAKDGTAGITVLESNGNVGLNYITPANKLDISGAEAIGYAGTSAPTNGLIVSGNVGIGTSTLSSGSTLNVVQNGNVTSDFGGYNTAVEIQNTSGTEPVLYINGSTANNALAGIVERGNATAFYAGLNNNANFRIAGITAISQTGFGNAKDGTAGITVLESNGNVGLNYITPVNALDISGAEAIGSYAGTTAPSNGLAVSGNVGVGTATPTSSNGGVGELLNVNTTGNNNAGITISSAGTSGSNNAGFIESRSTVSTSGDPRTGQIDWQRLTDVTTGAISSANDMYINNNGTLIEFMRVIPGAAGTAFVGISTGNTPAQRFEVGTTTGTVRIDGLKSGSTFNSSSTATTSNLVYVNNSTGDLSALPTVANSILTTNASGIPTWTSAAATNAWTLTGNSISAVFGTNYIGTTNTAPLEFVVNGTYNGVIDGTKDNVYFGSNAPSNGYGGAGNNDAGEQNVAIGMAALGSYTTTSGVSGNVAVGAFALPVNSTGLYNTSVGSYSSRFNTGSQNTALGSNALQGDGAGNNNTSVGFESMVFPNSSTASSNVAVGAFSLQATASNRNVGVGDSALWSLTSGESNTAIGFLANVNSGTISNATAIGANSVAPTSNSVTLGNASVSFAGGSGAGLYLPGYGASGSLLYTSTTTGLVGATGVGMSGEVLTSNGTGAPTWVTPAATSATAWQLTGNTVAYSPATSPTNYLGTTVSGGTGFQFGVNGSNAGRIEGGTTVNTALGYLSLNPATTGSQNSALGARTLNVNTTGSQNSAVGNGSLTSNTSGSNNSALGFAALADNTSGASNTGIGADALNNNTLGGNNAALGYEALEANTSGNNNVAVGTQAMYSNRTGASNVAVGENALYSDIIPASNGSQNTAIGTYSLYGSISGAAQNTAVGDSALTSNTTGAQNTAVGYNANVSSGALTNATAVGANASVAQSNSLVLGSISGVNGATANTTVGVGTTTPNSSLQVNGSMAVAVHIITYANTASGSYNAGVGANSGDYMIEANCSGGNITIYLPDATATVTGRLYLIVRHDGSTFVPGNSLTIEPTISGQTIGQYTSTTGWPVLGTDYQQEYVMSDGFNWIIITSSYN